MAESSPSDTTARRSAGAAGCSALVPPRAADVAAFLRMADSTSDAR
ncbi:hypothetical protein PV371_26965 [Streptomyces sp. TX20-6-3]|nr:hypothetical protein [Streptomyces sp. TX20-6-3]MDX2563277.1 hypothetical protein [Streptomyces sp. TX20-6-3]